MDKPIAHLFQMFEFSDMLQMRSSLEVLAQFWPVPHHILVLHTNQTRIFQTRAESIKRRQFSSSTLSGIQFCVPKVTFTKILIEKSDVGSSAELDSLGLLASCKSIPKMRVMDKDVYANSKLSEKMVMQKCFQLDGGE